ncbi:RNF31 ligase, partial [Leucopsar rothschildi]|nr:RNF31 ligase [Leucopsar rothschildi]
AQPSPAPSQVWPCPRCTFLNRSHAPTCEVCGLGHAPSADVTHEATTPPGVVPPTSGSGDSTSGSAEVASGSNPASSGAPSTTSGCARASSGSPAGTSGSGHADTGSAAAASGSGPAPSQDALRQRKLLEDGRRLVALVRAAESQGLPPESLGPSPFSEIPEFSGPSPDLESQIRHFRSRLGGVLKALAEEGSSEKVGGASLGPFSLAEAAWAWLEGEGRMEQARCALIGRRKQQLRLLSSLGFPDQASASAALQRNQGSQ